MDECNTNLKAYTLYRHLGEYCTHPSVSSTSLFSQLIDGEEKSS